MQVSSQISPQIIAGAVGLLQPYIPELSTQNLIEALKNIGEASGGKRATSGEFLTIRQAAAFLQVSKPTLYRLVRDGKLTITKASRRASRIPAESVRAFLANGGYTQEAR